MEWFGHLAILASGGPLDQSLATRGASGNASLPPRLDVGRSAVASHGVGFGVAYACAAILPLWLLGLIPIAMLSWIAVQVEHEGIENDLARRTEDALHRTGLDWAVARFNGRDGVVTGKAIEDRGPQRALALVRNVWGVRTANNRSGLVRAGRQIHLVGEG